MATVEVQAAPVRLALRLAPKTFGKAVPRDLQIEPHGEGVRLFATDGVTAVIIETDGHCSQRVAIPTQALSKVLERHNDAELLAVAPTPDGGDWAWRIKTYSDTFTAVAEMPRGEPLHPSGVERVLEIAETQERSEGGTWSVLALTSLAKLLAEKNGAKLDRVSLTTVGTTGPLVVTFACEGFTGTLLIMRCGEKAK
ncbi:MAG: hypothetical protein KME02_03775 [Aphanothece saxicola GSE-SYN-MK-01-06B]|jgi:hypothetical protein|nr:hypothetical protein [Aphanothece saxicola GSE-SYN-MK-01-06B]